MFSELDKPQVLSETDIGDAILVANLPIHLSGFQRYQSFFASIGYIALQVAMIEDEIRQSLIDITDDIQAVQKQSLKKNLGALISLYELVFLSKFGKDTFLRKSFYAVKKVLQKANQYRNEAVHSGWAFIEGDENKACYIKETKSNVSYVLISPQLMQLRAQFAHSAYIHINHLRAISGAEGWCEDGRSQANEALSVLIKELSIEE